MTRAEQAALKAYPGKITVINEDGTESIWEDSVIDSERRHQFIKGYEYAEKDLALSREDIRKIVTIADDLCDEWGSVRMVNEGQEVYYNEILRRFNETKKI